MSNDAAGLTDDSLARDRASDPGRSVLLQAPAGSGKTTVLTERLLRLLAEVDDPEEILAITFTRKAAAEMRARVLRALRVETDTSTSQGARLDQYAQRALARSVARGWDLANDPGRLRIQTIDSFNFRLATQLTVTAKAGGSLVISERPDELYERAAQETLASADTDPQLATDVELLFERLDNNWGNVQRLLADMLKERGHWLRYVLGHGPDALCARVNRSLREITLDHLRAACSLLPVSLLREVSHLPGMGPLGPELESIPCWRKLASLTMTSKCEWRKPKGINRSMGPEYESPEAKDALRGAIERLAGVAGFHRALVELASLPQARLSDADSAAIEALSRVLRSAAAHLQAQFALTGRVDHTYVAGAAREALTEGGLPTDLALRTGLSLRHILVDEFQDTSLAQFDLLQMLTAGWEEGDGRTLFLVGDPMQSIYQFREAEVGLFLRARERGIGAVRLEALRLTRNFRSRPPLIDWINKTFAELFPVADDLRSSAVSYTPSDAGRMDASCSEPPVSVRMFDCEYREEEVACMVARIRRLRSEDPAATTAVLVASRSHAAPVMTALDELRIDAVGVDLVPLRELPIVRDLVSLLQALSHLGDRTAWLAVLRAPWCGLSLQSLSVLSARRDSALVWESIGNEQRLTALGSDELRRLVRVREVLRVALENRDTLPLAEWLESTWLRLGAADAYAAAELRHARAFFDALSERVASGEWGGSQQIGSLLKDLFAQPQPTSSNPVQLMTIHRAKGLEFDHVFVPSLDRDLNRGREPLLRWLDLPRESGESDLIMAPVPTIGDEEGGDVNRYVKRLASKRAANEQVRLLYVAATRARKSLFLSACPKNKADGTTGPRNGTLLACLWPAIAPIVAAASDQAIGQDGDGSGPGRSPGNTGAQPLPGVEAEQRSIGGQPLRRLVAGWTLPELLPAAELSHLPVSRRSLELPEFSWVGETARHIGTVVHGELEKLAAREKGPDADEIRSQRAFYSYQLRRHGVPEPELTYAADVVVRALTRTVQSERGRWIFAPEHREARSEWMLTGIAAGRLTNVVIDRSFVDSEGVRWVIDFKTSSHEGGGLETFLEHEMERYRPQLETYVALVRGLGTAPVRAALYFPLLDVFRELPQLE